MNWEYFIYFALVSVGCWLVGSWSAFRGTSKWVSVCMLAGWLVLGTFIALMWVSLERPPLRTLGETRLWYSFFLPLVGWLVYLRGKYPWILGFSTLLSAVFIGINLLKPEIHDKVLVPALQSPWFVPHVILYMFAYALLGASALLALYGLSVKRGTCMYKELLLCDHLVYAGGAFLTLGLLTGALWAKEAWGHYWTWDPKETWAAVTWFSYLSYIHLRIGMPDKWRTALYLLLWAFACLQVCWWGINYLPSAQGSSLHVYGVG